MVRPRGQLAFLKGVEGRPCCTRAPIPMQFYQMQCGMGEAKSADVLTNTFCTLETANARLGWAMVSHHPLIPVHFDVRFHCRCKAVCDVTVICNDHMLACPPRCWSGYGCASQEGPQLSSSSDGAFHVSLTPHAYHGACSGTSLKARLTVEIHCVTVTQ